MRKMKEIIILFSVAMLSWACQTFSAERDLQLDKIKLPEGFKIEVFASGLRGARSMSLSPSGVLYVGTLRGGKVYAVKESKVFLLAKGLQMSNGVAFRDGHLYVAERSRIIKFVNIEKDLSQPPQPVVIYDKYPNERHHGWKYIAFGPDGWLYVPVGAPCNICKQEDKRFASITRLNVETKEVEVYAEGVRNSVGFTWHPTTKELWFTDNGRDHMGDDLPPCELNRSSKPGQHFGFPYCHGGSVPDPDFKQLSCESFVKPVQPLGAHVAPLGLKFYTGTTFPSEYRHQVFIAEHGSWNRSKKVGYKVSLVKLKGNEALSYEDFATGWLDEETQKAWGRPVDVLNHPDGSLLVSDDWAGVIYRISYKGKQ